MTSLLTAFVPIEFQGTTFEEEAVVNGARVGNKYHQRVHNGHHVVDISLAFYNRLLNSPNGLAWEEANPEIKEWFGESDRRTMVCNAFPGIDRPQPTEPTEATTKMVKLRAPIGVTAISHEGVSFKIDESGIIEADENMAATFASHGFLPA